MPEVSLEERYDDLLKEAQVRAESGGDFVGNALFDIFAEIAAECGESQDIERAHHEVRGQQVDGYHYDDSDGTMTIVVADLGQETSVRKLDTKSITTFFKRAENFIEKTVASDFLPSLEESSEIWRLADIMHNKGRSIERIKILLLSNAILTSRLAALEIAEVNGRKHSYHILDFSRYAAIVGSRNKREAVEIDFKELNISPMKFLETADSETYSSYLVSVPGADLANLYDLYGSRLLEQNVRTFLQARGKVNKGIINTIKNEPTMFFAYNNGLTATAASVEKSKGKITSISDLQIVNGGQTTASLLHARDKEKSDLSSVYVQMKLSVIKDQERLPEIVSNISRFANTQNKISESDLFANEPFHIRMEGFSRTIWAPVKLEEIKPTKWFYERARGQYQDSQFLAKESERKKFKAEYPREQLFNKTDLAKYYMSYERRPNIVGKGAQANFREFAKLIAELWNKNNAVVNEFWYHEAVAKAILFRTVDKIAATIAKDRSYDRGYKAHMVSYSVAWLIERIDQIPDRHFDCGLVWREQGFDEKFLNILQEIVGAVGEVLTNPPAEFMRLGREWCKIPFCWEQVKKLKIPLDMKSVEKYLADSEQVESEKRSAAKSQKMDSNLEWEIECVKLQGEWVSVLEFAKENGIGVNTDTERAVRHVAGNKPPNAKQAQFLKDLLRQAEEIGYKRQSV